MPKSDRYRSRFFPRDYAEYLRNFTTGAQPWNIPPLNQTVHPISHPPKAIIYTSKATLDTNAGTPMYPSYAGRIVSVRLNVAGAPSSTLTCDILNGGSSMFDSGDTKPTIASGSLYGATEMILRASFEVDDKLQVQLTATGSATGPMIVTILYTPGAS